MREKPSLLRRDGLDIGSRFELVSVMVRSRGDATVKVIVSGMVSGVTW
jgi:hypothetical protein